MNATSPWSRRLVIAGLVGMVIGLVDPLEGALVILLGVGLAASGMHRDNSRHRALLYWSFCLVAAGVSAMWGLSAAGGFGGDSGRSTWWALALLPYPIGWIMGIVGAIMRLRQRPDSTVPSTPSASLSEFLIRKR